MPSQRLVAVLAVIAVLFSLTGLFAAEPTRIHLPLVRDPRPAQSVANATPTTAATSTVPTAVTPVVAVTPATPTATAQPTTTTTDEPIATATVEPTATATDEPIATATVKPTATATAEPSATATTEPTATPTIIIKPAATATDEPTATPTIIIKPTATSEPTATPTPCVSVYPIAVNSKVLSATGSSFTNPGDTQPMDGVPDYGWRIFTSGPFAGRTARKLVIGDSTLSYDAAFLRWNESVAPGGVAASSSEALQNSMSFPGNLAASFEEAPWPSQPAPLDYPGKPGTLNTGDWIYGSSGDKSILAPTLDQHIAAMRVLTLPVVDSVGGVGNSIRYHAVSFKRFVLLSHKSTSMGLELEFVLVGSGAVEPLCAPNK